MLYIYHSLNPEVNHLVSDHLTASIAKNHSVSTIVCVCQQQDVHTYVHITLYGSSQLTVDLLQKLQMALSLEGLLPLWGIQHSIIAMTFLPLGWETAPLPAKMMEHGRTRLCVCYQVSAWTDTPCYTILFQVTITDYYTHWYPYLHCRPHINAWNCRKNWPNRKEIMFSM